MREAALFFRSGEILHLPIEIFLFCNIIFLPLWSVPQAFRPNTVLLCLKGLALCGFKGGTFDRRAVRARRFIREPALYRGTETTWEHETN